MKKKILIMCNSLHGGGAEKVLQTLLHHIDKSRYDITLYSVKADNSLDFPKEIKCRTVYLKSKNRDNKIADIANKFYVRICNKLRHTVYTHCSSKVFYRLFIRGKYDVEVAFIEGYSTRIIGGSTNRRSKKIAWVHTDMYNNHWSLIAYKNGAEESNTYRKFDKIIGVSKGVSESVSKLDLKITNTKVIYNPINDNEILEKSNEKVDLKGEIRNFKLISVGRLVEEKGFDRLIRIISELQKEGFRINLYIIGDGVLRQELENLVLDLNLEENVYLLGYKDNPYPYIRKCDAFVSSSRIEGFSTVVSEALILGKPVVATNCAGMNELLGNESEFGLLVNNDDESLKNGIISIMETDVYKNYKDAAQKRGGMFNLEKTLSEVEEILK